MTVKPNYAKARKRNRQLAEERQAAEEKLILANALKARGFKTYGNDPKREIEALVDYVRRLEAIKVELTELFGSIAAKETRRLNVTIKDAIGMIRRRKVDQAKPKGV